MTPSRCSHGVSKLGDKHASGPGKACPSAPEALTRLQVSRNSLQEASSIGTGAKIRLVRDPFSCPKSHPEMGPNPHCPQASPGACMLL